MESLPVSITTNLSSIINSKLMRFINTLKYANTIKMIFISARYGHFIIKCWQSFYLYFHNSTFINDGTYSYVFMSFCPPPLTQPNNGSMTWANNSLSAEVHVSYPIIVEKIRFIFDKILICILSFVWGSTTW